MRAELIYLSTQIFMILSLFLQKHGVLKILLCAHVFCVLQEYFHVFLMKALYGSQKICFQLSYHLVSILDEIFFYYLFHFFALLLVFLMYINDCILTLSHHFLLKPLITYSSFSVESSRIVRFTIKNIQKGNNITCPSFMTIIYPLL